MVGMIPVLNYRIEF